MNNKYNDLYYTVFKNKDDQEIVKDDYEKNDNDYFILKVFITPNLYFGIENDNVILK